LLTRDAIDVGGDERLREDLLEVSRRGVLTGVLVPKDMAKSFIVFFHVFDSPRKGLGDQFVLTVVSRTPR
jgi:hypothetical protein